ncbi:outer membrane beta-barrel protein [Kiritimatiellota bacterium B12222]|nr:outer membrane beta-barrel protein [Kiritimatiellota bacterium B12222]
MSLHAQNAKKPFPVDITNYVRLQYDDNVYTTNADSPGGIISSWVILEQVEFLLDTQRGNTYFGLSYSPTYKYYEDRPGDKEDWNQDLNFKLSHDFTPRTSVNVGYIFRYSDEPSIETGDVTFRNNNDYYFNAVDVSVVTQVVPEKTSLKFSGRYVDYAYVDDQVAETSDYQDATAGFDVIQVMDPSSTLALQLRYSDLQYKDNFRSSDTTQAGLAYNKTFNPKFTGEIRGGYESLKPTDENAQDSDNPYVDATLRYEPLKGNRFAVGLGYNQAKSPVNTFTLQERFVASGSYSTDLTALLTLDLAGYYSLGNFSEGNATVVYDPEVNSTGDETIITFIATLSYELNVRNSLVLNYTYTELESEVRPDSDYDRNRGSLGWQYNF